MEDGTFSDRVFEFDGESESWREMEALKLDKGRAYSVAFMAPNSLCIRA